MNQVVGYTKLLVHTPTATVKVTVAVGVWLSLNTAWLLMHSPYLSQLKEIADGGCHASAMKHNLCCLLLSACLHYC